MKIWERTWYVKVWERKSTYRMTDGSTMYVLRSKLVCDFKNKPVTPSYRECPFRKNNETMNVSELWGNKKLPRMYIRNCVAMNLLRSSDFEYHRPVLKNVGQQFICVMLVFGHIQCITHAHTNLYGKQTSKKGYYSYRLGQYKNVIFSKSKAFSHKLTFFSDVQR